MTARASVDGSGSLNGEPYKACSRTRSRGCAPGRWRHSDQDAPTQGYTRADSRSACGCRSAGRRCRCAGRSTPFCRMTCGWPRCTPCETTFTRDTVPHHGGTAITSARMTARPRPFGVVRSGRLSVPWTACSWRRWRLRCAARTVSGHLRFEVRHRPTMIIAATSSPRRGANGPVDWCSRSRRIAFCITWCAFSSVR